MQAGVLVADCCGFPSSSTFRMMRVARLRFSDEGLEPKREISSNGNCLKWASGNHPTTSPRLPAADFQTIKTVLQSEEANAGRSHFFVGIPFSRNHHFWVAQVLEPGFTRGFMKAVRSKGHIDQKSKFRQFPLNRWGLVIGHFSVASCRCATPIQEPGPPKSSTMKYL